MTAPLPSRVLLVGLLLLGTASAGAEIPPAERRSDAVLLAPETLAMQADDTANPGMLSVLEGEDLWTAVPSPGGRSCQACHGEARTSMRGVAARYPAWSEAKGAPIDLAGQVNLCREARQAARPFPAESRELLGLATFVAHQSRGLPIAPPADARLSLARERGRALFTRRIGQLNLSCAACHDDNWGKRLGGTPIPQAHPVGYPIYRLEWQSIGSLQRRFRNCMTGVRAEPFPFQGPEFVELEAYLMERAAGLAIETPAVRP
jgi:sulfur-oxidizing protein SoxA